ncbi:hypothetical protein ACL02R_01955 [Streptomyces sp. MS19]|uniref:hypothetical protein n=1 Tax=Streptomyces sp. MS19 TaxID=3385972 RepID=UPI00399FAEC3
MRIRTALASGVLAATFVVGTAGGALAHGSQAGKSAEVEGAARVATCQIHAGISHGDLYYDEGCFSAGMKFAAKKEAFWKK